MYNMHIKIGGIDFMKRLINYQKVYYLNYFISSQAHFLWILEGKCELTINNKVFSIKDDTLLFIPSYISYKIEADELTTFISIPLEKDDTSYTNVYIGLESEYKSQLVSQLLTTDDNISSINDLMYTLDKTAKYEYSYFIVNLKISPRIYSVIKELSLSYMNRLYISDLASKLYINQSYLSTLFKKEIKCTISSYLQAIRIESTLDDLINTNKSLSTICSENGIADMRTLNLLFKTHFGISPSEFRKKIDEQYTNILLSHTQELFNKYYQEHNSNGNTIINLDLSLKYNPNTHRKVIDAFNCFALGKASDLLLSSIQNQVHIAKSELNFKYCTFHNLFGDEMNVISGEPSKGYQITLNNIFEVLDFLISEDIIPIVEIGYFPKQIASRYHSPFTGYTLNTGGIIDFNLWEQLVTEVFTRLNNRYSNINQWYFSFFSAVDFRSFWPNSYADLRKLYQMTYTIAKSINPQIKVGGFGFANITDDSLNIEKIIQEIISPTHQLDFISLHSYPYSVENSQSIVQTQKLVDVKMNYKADRLVRDVKKLQLLCNKFDIPEGIINEWNSIISRNDPLNDEIYKSASIVKNFILLNRKSTYCKSICYWVLSDCFNEHGLNKDEFHGGIGLLSYHGIKKPVYYSFVLLNKIEGYILDITTDYLITQHDEKIQLLVHNCNKSNSGSYDNKNLHKDLFCKVPRIDVCFSAVDSKDKFMVNFYKVDINTSAKNWAQKIDANTYINKEQTEYLNEKAKLQTHSEILEVEQLKNLNIWIEENEVMLLEVIKLKKIE